MPVTKNGNQIDTDNWTIVWNPGAEELDLNSKHGKKHTKFFGDPHIQTDGGQPTNFPTAVCSFVLDDGNLLVAHAPGAGSPLDDAHMFTDDGQHISLGSNPGFDGTTGTVFVQQDDGSFYPVVAGGQFRDVT